MLVEDHSLNILIPKTPFDQNVDLAALCSIEAICQSSPVSTPGGLGKKCYVHLLCPCFRLMHYAGAAASDDELSCLVRILRFLLQACVI